MARTILLLAAFPVLLHAQLSVHQDCEVHVSVRDSAAKPIQARLDLTGTGTFIRRLSTDPLGDATFQNLPTADFRLLVRLSDGREIIQDVSTGGPDCEQFEVVRIAKPTDSLGISEVFVGDLDVPKPAARLYSKAIKDIHRQSWHNAENELEQAVRVHPTFARAYDALGVAATENGDTATADEAFRDAIKLRKVYPEAYLNFARFLIRQRREAEAYTVLNDLLAFDRQNPVGETLLARCLFDEQKYPELVAFIQRLHVQHRTHEAIVHEYAAEYFRRRGMAPEYQSERETIASESRIHR